MSEERRRWYALVGVVRREGAAECELPDDAEGGFIHTAALAPDIGTFTALVATAAAELGLVVDAWDWVAVDDEIPEEDGWDATTLAAWNALVDDDDGVVWSDTMVVW
ncbi:hypothetical protein DSM104299_00666 [Baekduia alba]|uniref:hypothetical protein n=1 Tax=Baekduia alba TaxID=2997333 RepID=UPI0023427A3A|nr:hypothetical protein [Baekduia alba]WCB91985.1 hypothetical protein DSM104299_00666 [Baekduia alba]